MAGMDAPFTLEPGADGSAILTVPPARLTLDQEALRELRAGIDAAVARGAVGGQGAVHRFEVGDATVTVSAVPGGSVNLRIDR
jgi:alpha-D-ribose 1-methylphosphonate 5-triphosphate synthase subunit PhnG